LEWAAAAVPVAQVPALGKPQRVLLRQKNSTRSEVKFKYKSIAAENSAAQTLKIY